jgi:hypothetical protein
MSRKVKSSRQSETKGQSLLTWILANLLVLQLAAERVFLFPCDFEPTYRISQCGLLNLSSRRVRVSSCKDNERRSTDFLVQCGKPPHKFVAGFLLLIGCQNRTQARMP